MFPWAYFDFNYGLIAEQRYIKRCNIMTVGTLRLFQDQNLDAFGSIFHVLHHVFTTQVAIACLIAKCGGYFIKYDVNFRYGKKYVTASAFTNLPGMFLSTDIFTKGLCN